MHRSLGLSNTNWPVLCLPFHILRDRYLTPQERRAPYFRHCTLFQDIVIRCTRHAFSELPPNVARVFFTKEVTLPFLLFRIWRHGHFWFRPFQWREISQVRINLALEKRGTTTKQNFRVELGAYGSLSRTGQNQISQFTIVTVRVS